MTKRKRINQLRKHLPILLQLIIFFLLFIILFIAIIAIDFIGMDINITDSLFFSNIISFLGVILTLLSNKKINRVINDYWNSSSEKERSFMRKIS